MITIYPASFGSFTLAELNTAVSDADLARTDAANTFTGIQAFSTPIAATSVSTMTATVGGGVPTPPNNTTTFLRGDGTFAIPPSGSSATTGSTTVNFGTGKTDVSISVADATIGAAQLVQARIFPKATATNTVDDHWVEDLEVLAGNVSAGVGFSIYAKCNTGRAHGTFTVAYAYL